METSRQHVLSQQLSNLSMGAAGTRHASMLRQMHAHHLGWERDGTSLIMLYQLK